MPNFTKQAIKASFLKLLKEQPLNKISVREIVEDCGINRNSFYYHFQDIPALIEEIITESADSLVQKYPTIRSAEEFFHAAFQFALDNKKVVLHIFQSVNRAIYENYLMRCCEYIVTTYLDTVFGQQTVNEADRRVVIDFLKCALFGVSIDWVSKGMPDSSVGELQRFIALCHGLSDEIIRRCNEMDCPCS